MLHAAVEAFADLFFRVGPDDTILDYHAASDTYLYAPPEKFLRKPVEDFLPPEIGNAYQKAVDELRRSGKPASLEYTLPMPDGPHQREAQLRLADDGEIAVVVRDITSRREMEEMLRLMQVSVDQAPDAVLWIGPDGRFKHVNQAACSGLGYSREELLCMSVHDIDPELPPEGWPERWRELVERGSFSFESSHRDKDGEVLPVEVTYNHLHLDGREYNVVLARDISERKGLEAQREAMLTELEEKNRELERFTYTVSHDLKAPLIAINGFLGLLEEDTASGDRERVNEDIAELRRVSRRMGRLLENLLELSRIGRVTRPPEKVALLEVVQVVEDSLSESIASQGVELVIAPDLPSVLADRDRLAEVFQNLLGNALHFMGEQPDPRVEITAEVKQGEVLCRVRDNGIGIEPRYHEAVFHLFHRLDSATPGTGVGLAIVKRIVEFHGGQVWVESEGDGKGSTFICTLPAA
jgi:PAS domain S-box-containing protein